MASCVINYTYENKSEVDVRYQKQRVIESSSFFNSSSLSLAPSVCVCVCVVSMHFIHSEMGRVSLYFPYNIYFIRIALL